MASDLNDDAFQRELLDLFTLEAQEWLQQAQDAFQDLQRQTGSTLDPQPINLMQQVLTNLGGSAATVELPAIEEQAYAVLPLMDTVRDQGGPPTSDQLTTLMQCLERIADSIYLLSGSNLQAGGTPESTASSSKASASASPAAADRETSIEALRNLQQDLAATTQSSRGLVELVIEKAGGGRGAKGGRLDGSTITKVLRELEGLDEEFLSSIQQHMPRITEAVSALKTSQGGESQKALKPLIKSVEELRDAAKQVQAASVVQFLKGLHIFLTVVASHGTGLVATRMEAVEFRLGAVIPMVHQWVEMGRLERAAIGRLLSA